MNDECSMQPQKSVRGQKSQRLRWLHDRPTLLTGTKIFVRIEGIHHWRKVLHDICNMQLFFVKFIATILTVPEEGIKDFFGTNQLDNQTNRIGWTLRRMWSFSWQHEDVSFVDWNIDRLAIFDNFEHHIAFQLEIKLFRFVVMVVFPVVRTTYNHHNDIVGSFIHRLVTHRRFEKMSVFVDPFLEIKRSLDGHKR